jgi:CDP-diacylglycerol--glycerol-3-phosphate 3-phosphatidyltransferase
MRNQLRAGGDRVLRPLARRLCAWGVSPNHVTLTGFALNVVAAALIVGNELLAAGIVWLLAGTFDMLDGALARTYGQVAAFGAFLDSTLDRLSEGVVLAAACYHLAALGQPVDAALAALALLGSLTVSYARARAESLGANCTAGLLTRTERVVLLGFGLCVGLLELAIYFLLAFTVVTVMQRIWQASRELSAQR